MLKHMYLVPGNRPTKMGIWGWLSDVVVLVQG